MLRLKKIRSLPPNREAEENDSVTGNVADEDDVLENDADENDADDEDAVLGEIANKAIESLSSTDEDAEDAIDKAQLQSEGLTDTEIA